MIRRIDFRLVALLAVAGASVAMGGGKSGPGPVPNAAPVADGRADVIVQFTSPPLGKRTRLTAAPIALERSRLLGDLSRLKSGPRPFRFDYRRVFNGVAMTLSPGEVGRVRHLSYVKAVFNDTPVRATLMDSVPLIGAGQVWSQVGTTGAGVRVAVIDTGVDYGQPDLGSCFGAGCKVVGGYDFVNLDGDPMDDHGHGTHVAGIVAANGVVKGVAPGASILAYKALNSGGSGTESAIIAALDAAVDPDGDPSTDDAAQVVNLSLGGIGDPDDPLSQAVDGTVEAGVVVAAAAGNSGPNPKTITTPGTARKAITVGATNKLDVIANFSSRGPVVWPGGAIAKPDIVAPGVGICSTRWDNSWTGLECLDQRHVALSGTSMATPHIAGAAALLIDAHPDWTPAEIKMALRSTALNLGYDMATQGYGRVRVLAAAQLPHAPPVASISTSGPLTATADIHGTATSATFQSYALYVGEGMNPASWSLLTQSTSQVSDGILYANLNPCTLADGFLTLRLDVTDADGHVSQDRTLVLTDTLRLSPLQNNDIIRKGDSIELRGSILCGQGFQNYVVEYGAGHDPTTWLTSGVTLANGGTSPVVDGPLATWDTSAVGASGLFALRLTSNSSFGQRRELVSDLYLDPTLKAGWPQRIPYQFVPDPVALKTNAQFYAYVARSTGGPFSSLTSSSMDGAALSTVSTSSPEFSALAGEYYWAGLLEPVVSDLDGDGRGEVIVYKGGVPPVVLVFRDDGALMWSAPVGTAALGGGNLHIPLVADIDGDGSREVVVYAADFQQNFGKLYAFAHDGSPRPGWPIPMPVDYHPTFLAADLDRDGQMEIVFKGNGGNPRKMVVVGSNGQIRSQWDLTQESWGSEVEGSPAVGDLDGDGQLEIVTTDPSEFSGYDPITGEFNNTGIINVFRMDGSELPGWPRYTDGISLQSPAVGDIDHDGDVEIVVGLIYSGEIFPDLRYGGLYVFDGAGNILPGWPVQKGWNFRSSPSLGDLDGDGDLEIAASILGFVTYVFHHDGSVAAGWPQSTGWHDFYSTIMGDIDGDGAPDVLTTAGSASVGGGVYAWRHDGVPISGFPKLTEADAQGPVTITDIDHDGQVELVASSDWDRDLVLGADKGRGSIYVWDLPAPYSTSTMQWPHFQHDVRHTGLYRPIAASNSSAGRVPDGGAAPGNPLTISRVSGGDIKLTWGESCASTDYDYEIYEGALGNFTSHVPRYCTAGGATTRTFGPAPGSRYYLVVPSNGSNEGSYGRRSGSVERPQSAMACLPQGIAVVCE